MPQSRKSTRTLLITGGAGFIGSALVRSVLAETPHRVVNVDKLTYAASLDSLADVADDSRYTLEQADIADAGRMQAILAEHQPDLIIHLAAETHVDRSIDGPATFVRTNIEGTYTLLEASRAYWQHLRHTQADKAQGFRFHHVSTDEVYGDLGPHDPAFTEQTPYAPSSPYSASKASADHLVRAWHRTYGLPTLISNCSNNYGPRQFPEKLIPLMILNALAGKPLPVYGDGQQVRDWLFVEDHARALLTIACEGRVGETYNVGGLNEQTNLDVVRGVCQCLETLAPEKPAGLNAYQDLIEFVTDRPGHDRRYAINADKIQRELGWTPRESFDSGLYNTVQWYLNHREWWAPIQQRRYQGERLGLSA